MTRDRPKARSKFSSWELIVDHYSTLRDANTGRIRLTDHLIYLGVPLALALLIWWRDIQAGHIPEVLAAAAILTGLIFNVFVLLFDLTARAADKQNLANKELVNKLAGEVRANVSYAVMLGLVLTAVLGGIAMFTDTSKPLPSAATAIIVFIGAQMFLTISMILKRIRSLYRAFRQTDTENIP